MTFDLSLNQVDSAKLEALRTDGIREGRQLEYKEALPGSGDEDKREFLADVSSFANAAGGDLIYGVRERRDGDRKPTGEIETVIGVETPNLDAERLRLEALIRDGIDPRMPPVTFHEIPRGPGASCLLLRIPRSWTGLHMVTFKNLSRFFSRGSGGKYQLDVHEIRAGFVAAETAYERLRRFRAERLARIVALETPTPTGDGPKLIVHALPITQFSDVWTRFNTMTDHERLNFLPLIGGMPSTWHHNLDGFVLHTLRSDLSKQAYTQLFRDGSVEAVSGGVLAKDDQRGGFYASGMERAVIASFTRFQAFWQAVGVTPPLVVGLTLSGVRGWKVLHGPFSGFDGEGVLDRDLAMSPEVMFSDFVPAVDIVLRPLFDFVWNGGGWPASPNYREGRWVEPR